jgi:hypothetical protein
MFFFSLFFVFFALSLLSFPSSSCDDAENGTAIDAVIGKKNFIGCAALFVLREMEKMNDDEHFPENESLCIR